MIRTKFVLSALAVSLLSSAAALADSPAPVVPAAPPAATAPATPAAGAPQRVFGSASAIDTTAKSVTVSGFGGGPDTTFKYDDSTIFLQDVTAQTSDIKVGDTLRLFGQPSDDGKSIAPMFLSIVPESDLKDPPFAGNFQPITGVVATITPTLTITTDDKKTLTVDVSGSPRVIKSVDGKATDLKTSAFVNAIVTGPPAALLATKVHVFVRTDN
jgi:hypothetical protein